jgi:hypothetical protein
MRRVLLAVLVAVLTAAASAPVVGDTSTRHATRVLTVRLRAAVDNLKVSREIRTGYDRGLFRLWVDADGDCQDTRDEVLAAESTIAVSGCEITRGRWVSYYDRRVWRNSSDVDIDHLVPLAEAWDSGARRWNAGTRERYANDLGDRRTLGAVTDNVNQSKGDQDIREWRPQYGVCRYVREWTVVKTRWSLRVDRAEKHALVRLSHRCPNATLHLSRARVVRRGG